VSPETAPIVIAKTMIRDSEGRVLVLRRSETDKHRPGGVDFPGGSVELVSGDDVYETPLQAAIREALEEAAIELEPDQIEEVAVITETRERDGRIFKRHLFLARLAVIAADVDVGLDPEEHGAIHGWEQPEVLPELFDETSWVVGIKKAIQSGLLAA
jgi:8-oxo-dGTP pyrophosphatase MutT (NUDIX family)